MEISDILKQKEFQNLDRHLTQEMYSTAGTGLIEKMIDSFGDEEAARDWFYTPLPALGNKRAYDYCKAGCQKEVETVLGRLDNGVVM